jgi:hypothetical protein
LIDLVPVAWTPREPPLVPAAAIACDRAAFALADRLCAIPDDRLARLSGIAARSLIVVAGSEADLPWVDGVSYVGRDPAAPSLLLPTHLVPDVGVAIFERAVVARFAIAPPVVVLPDRALIFSLASALPITRGAVAAWRERAA